MWTVARPKGKRPRRAVNYRLPEDILAQLDKLTEQTRRTATAEIELALEAHLKKAKLWPPEEEKPDE